MMTATTSKQVLLSSGSNARGQLANGTVEDAHEFQPCHFHGQPPGSHPPHTQRIVDVASGANHTILLLEAVRDELGGITRELWGCGDGSSGQLGLAYQKEVKDRGEDDPWSMVFQPLDLGLEKGGLEGYSSKLIAASWETTYVALSSEEEGKGDLVIAMGSDDFGDLGIGGLEKGKGKARNTEPFHIANFDHLTVEGKSIAGRDVTVKSLAAGQHHVVVMLEVGTKGTAVSCVVGWGASRHGQLGKLLDKAGKPIPFASKPVLIPLNAGNGPIQSISLGMQHSVFLHTSGKITALGANRKGQLEGLDRVSNASLLGCTWNGTYVCVQNEDGILQLLATGSYMHGQLGRNPDSLITSSSPASLESVDGMPLPLGSQISLACGTEHVLALVCHSNGDSDGVWGWGWNEHGNLGTGSTEDVHGPKHIWPNGAFKGKVDSIQGIWAGCGTSWIYATTS